MDSFGEYRNDENQNKPWNSIPLGVFDQGRESVKKET